MKERMKHLIPLLLLVLALALTGCDQEKTEPTSEPTQVTTEPTVAVDYLALYTKLPGISPSGRTLWWTCATVMSAA